MSRWVWVGGEVCKGCISSNYTSKNYYYIILVCNIACGGHFMSEWVVTWVRRQVSGLGQLSQCNITCDTEQEVVFSAADSTFGTDISRSQS